MNIFSNFSGDCVDGINTYLKLEDYSLVKNYFLHYGIASTEDKSITPGRRKILLDLWSPCTLYSNPEHLYSIESFDRIYSICPYTTKWTNEFLGKDLMRYTFYPINPKNLNVPTKDKIFDVCFVGGIHSDEHLNCLSILDKFNYSFVSQSYHPKCTHVNLPNTEKLGVVAQSKIGVCFNILYLNRNQALVMGSRYPSILTDVFPQVRDDLQLPQFKSRIHEFALCKTLILCKRDKWNVVEDFYKENEDFLYFDNLNHLNHLISEITKNYYNYSHLLDSAYSKVMKYTSENLIEKINNE